MGSCSNSNECRATMHLFVPIIFLLLICNVNPAEPLMQESLSKLLGSLGAIKQYFISHRDYSVHCEPTAFNCDSECYSVRIPELLNQLCNESQGTDSIRQDACYGCFFKATQQPLGYPLLVSMSSCADLYLNNTDYGHCQQYLSNATSTTNTKVNPTTIYCTFLECIRQVNKDNLIRECVGESIRMAPKFNLTDVQLAQLFVNTTACVLAKTRCALMNPITGEFQDTDLASKFHVPTVNALLVNTDYNINIVQLPLHYGTADVCAKYRNYEQAAWPSVTC